MITTDLVGGSSFILTDLIHLNTLYFMKWKHDKQTLLNITRMLCNIPPFSASH